MRRHAAKIEAPESPPSGAPFAIELDLLSTPAAADDVQRKDSVQRSILASKWSPSPRATRSVRFAQAVDYAPHVEPQTPLEDPAKSPAALDNPATVQPPLSPMPAQRRKRSLPRKTAPEAPLPPTPFELHSDAILATLSIKSREILEAEIRHRAVQSGVATAFFSTLGLLAAAAFIVPVQLLTHVHVAIKAAATPAIWGFFIVYGLWLEEQRKTRFIATDRDSVRSLIINLSRLITDLDNLPRHQSTRRILLEEALKVLGEASRLDRRLTDDSKLRLQACAILFGPLVLLCHLGVNIKLRAVGYWCCCWAVGLDRRRFARKVGESVSDWGRINLEDAPRQSRLEFAEV